MHPRGVPWRWRSLAKRWGGGCWLIRRIGAPYMTTPAVCCAGAMKATAGAQRRARASFIFVGMRLCDTRSGRRPSLPPRCSPTHTSSPDSSRLDSSNQDGPTSPSQARRGREGGRDRRRTQRTRPARPSPPRRPTTRNQRPHADRPPEEKHPSPKTPQFQQRERRPPQQSPREERASQRPLPAGRNVWEAAQRRKKKHHNAPDTASPPRGLAT